MPALQERGFKAHIITPLAPVLNARFFKKLDAQLTTSLSYRLYRRLAGAFAAAFDLRLVSALAAVLALSFGAAVTIGVTPSTTCSMTALLTPQLLVATQRALAYRTMANAAWLVRLVPVASAT